MNPSVVLDNGVPKNSYAKALTLCGVPGIWTMTNKPEMPLCRACERAEEDGVEQPAVSTDKERFIELAERLGLVKYQVHGHDDRRRRGYDEVGGFHLDTYSEAERIYNVLVDRHPAVTWHITRRITLTEEIL